MHLNVGGKEKAERPTLPKDDSLLLKMVYLIFSMPILNKFKYFNFFYLFFVNDFLYGL